MMNSSQLQSSFVSNFVASIKVIVVTMIFASVLYPLSVNVIANLIFPHSSSGSLILDEDGKIIGSELIGQKFQKNHYFHSRPSMAGENGYDALKSGGSNLSHSSDELREMITTRAKQQIEINAIKDSNFVVPQDMITASGSGLDPHISIDAAYMQAERIANARKVSPTRVKSLIDSNIESRTFGILGNPRVNILKLNIALDRTFGKVK